MSESSCSSPFGGCRNRPAVFGRVQRGMFHACAGLLADAGAVGVRVDARESARTHARMVETDYDPSNLFIIQLDSYIYF